MRDASDLVLAGEHVQMFYFYAGTEVMWRAMDWFARTFAGVPTEASVDGPESPWIVTPDSSPEGGTPFLIPTDEMVHGASVTEAIVKSAASGRVEKVA